MKSKLFNLFMFTAGCIVGSFVTCKIFNNKMDDIVNDEISSMEKYYERKYNQNIEDENKENINKKEYCDIIDRFGYSEDDIKDEESPYVISPDEFGEIDEYEQITLFYYDDKKLADDMDELVEDVDNTVGYDSLERFGEYEDDVVYVRNDRLKSDFEILLSLKKYSEIKMEE